MLDLQARINAQVSADWRERAHPWYRAIWTECAELLEHHGWKWWKQQHPDRAQLALELVDIWHFGLSDWLQRQAPAADLAAALEQGLSRPAPADFLEAVEQFAGIALNRRMFDAGAFACLMLGADLSFEELYKSYVGKNVLNRFRQERGYATGTYIKIWQGREDNLHLVEAMAGLDADASDFQEALHRALTARYERLTQAG